MSDYFWTDVLCVATTTFTTIQPLERNQINLTFETHSSLKTLPSFINALTIVILNDRSFLSAFLRAKYAIGLSRRNNRILSIFVNEGPQFQDFK